MTEFENPYRAPASDAVAGVARSGRIDGLAFAAWPAVFGLNMVLPLFFSTVVTEHHGRFGLCIASFVLLAGGWALCAVSASTARKVILGAALVAVTQFFPVLQIIAGSVSMGIAQSFQLVEGGGGDPDLDEQDIPQITSELGGFIVTMLVGGILLTCASLIGLALGPVLPERWLKSNAKATERPISQ
jgi:hypothetical protein